MARVVPDVAALDRVLDYLVPSRFDGQVQPGAIVRVPLHGRRVRGWVVGRTDRPETDRPLQSVTGVTGRGPSAEVIELAGWAAWRWAGPRVAFLRAASPSRVVALSHGPRPNAEPGLRGPNAEPGLRGPSAEPGLAAPPPGVVADAFSGPASVVRLPPAADAFVFVEEAARRGDALVLAPSVREAAHVAARLRRAGHPVALLPDEWSRAEAGGCVAVGARGAAWAPRARLGAVVVLDEHDEAYQEERAPTWNARDVAVERARRAGVPSVLTSPCPSLETLAEARLLTVSRADEREGWATVEVVDRRADDPGLGLYSSRLVTLLRHAADGRRVVCVLNRKGRARLLACAECAELARCERCGAVVEEARGGLRCRRCDTVRPLMCQACGAGRLRVLRPGVSRVRDDLERLSGMPVAEVTAERSPGPPPDAPVLVGTEAVLHRVARAWAVAFVDLDQELLAPRWRAGEQALALLARAARVVGPRSDGGRLLLQTRLPTHEVIDAAVHADPSRMTVVEAARRVVLGFPPERAVAVVSGEAAAAFVAGLGRPGIELLGPSDGRWLVRAPDHGGLCDALAAAPRPRGRVRVSVDPLRT